MLVPFWAWALSGKPQTAAAQLKRFFPTLPVGTPPKKIMFASFEDRRPPKTGGEMLADGDVFSQHFATGEAHWAYCCKHSLPRRAKLEDNCWYIYIYIDVYTWNQFVLYFWPSTLRNKALSNQTRVIWVPWVYIYILYFFFMYFFYLRSTHEITTQTPCPKSAFHHSCLNCPSCFWWPKVLQGRPNATCITLVANHSVLV